jgi:hypothetical protein
MIDCDVNAEVVVVVVFELLAARALDDACGVCDDTGG